MESSKPRTKVELFFDVISPYTWFAFEVLCRYRILWNIELVLRPFFLGGVQKATDNPPPLTVPAKAAYMQADLKRNTAYFQVPLEMSEKQVGAIIDKGTLRPQRFLTTVDVHFPSYVEEVARHLWTRAWIKGQDITEDESLEAAARAAGMPPGNIKKCLNLVDDAAIKEQLKRTTEEAVLLGAFGAPTIVVHTQHGAEMFMGSDRFPLIAAMLKEEWYGPVPPRSTL